MQPPISKDQSPEKVAARMRAAFEMYEEGLAILKARLRREHPLENTLQIQERVACYLRADRQQGAGPIHPSTCPRFLRRS